MNDLYEALAKAQGEFKAITKNRNVNIAGAKTDYGFAYADLNELISATRPALSKHGLCVIQTVTTDGGAGVVTTMLCHASGQTISASMQVPNFAELSDPKKFGALITYLRRYQYAAMLCLAAEDDLDEENNVAPTVSDEIKQAFENAAVIGIEELQRCFEMHKSLPGVANMWREHGRRLKDIASRGKA